MFFSKTLVVHLELPHLNVINISQLYGSTIQYFWVQKYCTMYNTLVLRTVFFCNVLVQTNVQYNSIHLVSNTVILCNVLYKLLYNTSPTPLMYQYGDVSKLYQYLWYCSTLTAISIMIYTCKCTMQVPCSTLTQYYTSL